MSRGNRVSAIILCKFYRNLTLDECVASKRDILVPANGNHLELLYLQIDYKTQKACNTGNKCISILLMQKVLWTQWRLADNSYTDELILLFPASKQV